MPGGYVGVDVFFAISGFLITGHLLREADRGGIALPAFWARRIRRLLPAAALVLAASLVTTVVFLPYRLWQNAVEQIGAASVAALNWVLAANSVDYFAADAAPTAVQHFWSLAVEEQFYLVWPVLLWLVTSLLLRRPARRARVLAGVMTGVTAASLAWSVIATTLARAPAYFSTFTHAWEFAAGGLLALGSARLAAPGWAGRPWVRAIGSWVGIAAIVVAVFTFSSASPFPGWIAILPVGGALLVMACGTSTSRLQRPLFLTSRPVRFVGDISYSFYLWHWPPIVLLPFVLGHANGTKVLVAILIGSFVAGWLSKRFVEDPIRRWRPLQRRTWLGYILAAPVVVALVAGCIVSSSTATATADAEQGRAAHALQRALADPCFGAAAMAQKPETCPHSHVPRAGFGPDVAAEDWGSIAGVTKDGNLPGRNACTDFSGGFLDCPIGDPDAKTTIGDPDAKTTIAIVGDSHALALTEPIVKIAQAHGWAVRGLLRNSCTPNLPLQYTQPGAYQDCNDWRRDVATRIADDPRISVVVVTGFTRAPVPKYDGTHADLVRAYAGMTREWTVAGKKVVVVGDVPLTSGADVPGCVDAAQGAADPCTVPRALAAVDDPAVDAARNVAGVRVVDLDNAFCDARRCHAVIGGLIAYRDAHHLTASFALTLVPLLQPEIQAAAR